MKWIYWSGFKSWIKTKIKIVDKEEMYYNLL